ncbi:hypothetical protein B0H11DRAFT_2362454 [Mycena galericulata]|nr:hypothetical protein B0H11DRAFT_2362454 [Mycena galericulata]
MSSRASTPPFDDDDDDFRGMRDAMAQSSPIAPSASGAPKRSYVSMVGGDDTGSDNEHRAGTAPAFALANQNIDPASLREAKLLANIFAVGNHLEKLVGSKAAYEVSADLTTNIKKYAPAVLLSSKINVYKGDTITDVLLSILKNHRFDIPPSLENGLGQSHCGRTRCAYSEARESQEDVASPALNKIRITQPREVIEPE